jgi:Superinfection immunity protein
MSTDTTKPEVKARRFPFQSEVLVPLAGLALYEALLYFGYEAAAAALLRAVIVGGISIGLVALYFLPSIVADKRNHNNTSAINLLNLLFGWTLLGWGIALIWANTNNVGQRPARTNPVLGVVALTLLIGVVALTAEAGWLRYNELTSGAQSTSQTEPN